MHLCVLQVDKKMSQQKKKKGHNASPSRNKDNCQHEVTLVVGKHSFVACRKKLAAESEYFRALFSGMFAESDSEKIDLTKDVDNIGSFKLMLQFISKRKKREISLDNVEELVKLGTFFMIDSLRKACATFIYNNTTVTNCIKNYFLYVNYALPAEIHEIPYMCSLKDFLSTRFHDYLIFEDEVKHLSLEELQHFVQAEIFKYCTKESLGIFICDWIVSNMSLLCQENLTIVQDVVAYCDGLPNSPQSKDQIKAAKRMLQLLDSKAISDDLKSHFTDMFESLIKSLQEPKLKDVKLAVQEKNEQTGMKIQEEKIEMEAKHYQTRSRPKNPDGKKNKDIGNKTIQMCKRPVVFSFSMRQYYSKNAGESPTQVTEQPTRYLFDFCVFDVNTETWYHLAQFDDDRYSEQFNDKPSKYSNEFKDPECFPILINTMFVFENEITIRDANYCEKLVRYNMKNHKWRTVSILDIVGDYISFHELLSDFRFVPGKNGLLYLLVRVSIYDDFVVDNDEEAIGMEYRGFLVNPKSLELEMMFNSATLPVNKDEYIVEMVPIGDVPLTVKVSSQSDEMFIIETNRRGIHVAFVAHLSKDGKSVLDMKTVQSNISLADTESFFGEAEIVEIEDSFLIGLGKSQDFYDIRRELVVLQYKFQSDRLTMVERTENQAFDAIFHQCCHADWMSLTHLCTCRDSFWIMEESYELNTKCIQVILSEEGEPQIRYHKPPPFNNPLALYGTEVDSKFFEKLKPVQHFLDTQVWQ